MEPQSTSPFVRCHQRKASSNGNNNNMSDHQGFMYSTDSVLSLINNFVRSVGAMEDTVLVPSRLMDVAVASNKEAGDLSPSDAMLHRAVPKWAGKSHADLFSFFTAIKRVHSTLLWGGKDRLMESHNNNNGNNNGNNNSNSNSNKRFYSATPTVQVTNTSSSVALISEDSQSNNNKLPVNIVRQPSSVSLVSGFEEDAEADADADADADRDAEVSSTDDSSDSGLDQEQRARDDTLRQMSDKFAGHLCGLLDCLQEFTAVAHVVSQRYQEEVGNLF